MAETKKSKTLGIISIVLGATSFIPMVGIFLGVIAIILGIIDIKKNKSKLGIIGLILGIIGILISIGLYGSLFYFGFVKRGGVYDELRIQNVQEQQLPNTINLIESYKARFGKYPDKIEDLSEISADPFTYTDQLQIVGSLTEKSKNGENDYFYYENKGDSYILFSKGVDGIPYSQDDVYPILTSEQGNIGYRRP